MNHELRRAVQLAEKKAGKAKLALDVVPTVEARAHKDALVAKLASLRVWASKSDQADAVVRVARGTIKEREDAMVAVTNSAVRIIASSGKANLLAPFVTDGSASVSEVAEYLVTSLKGLPEAGMVLDSVNRSLEARLVADGEGKQAEAAQFDAERELYVSIRDFNHELENAHSYIRVNTELESAARKKLKRRSAARKPKTAEAEAPAADAATVPAGDDSTT